MTYRSKILLFTTYINTLQYFIRRACQYTGDNSSNSLQTYFISTDILLGKILNVKTNAG